MTDPATNGRFENLDADAVRAEIEEVGYAIVKDLIPSQDIDAISQYWLRTFPAAAEMAPTIWGPFLGEQNRVLFHRSGTDCLYRAYDFLWNPALHDLTRAVGLHLNRERNRVTESGDFTGETFQADRYAVYLTVSYYPPGDGRMGEHADQSDGRRHWQFIMPLTFKGRDYQDGGLHLKDRAGNDVDVDGQMEPGSVVLFDGSLPHRVDRVGCADGQSLGRMQLFFIPTFMERPEESDRLLENFSALQFAKAKLRPLKHRLQGLRGPAPSEKYFR